ncbi:MAG: HAD hydrolase-like protein, partial [Amnibacterium sp.]
MPQTLEPYTVALVDLDGTIMDSAPGITATLTRTLERMGLPVPPPSRLVEFVGPPILDGLRDLAGLDPEQSQRALELYRDEYRRTGDFDARPYPGMREALEAVRDAGPTLAVATSKPESQAKRILAHFGFDDLFAVIAGASEDEVRSEKADVITWALQLLRGAGVDIDRPVMIGDRIHDVEGAARPAIPCVFVVGGYGDPAAAGGAIAVAETPVDLVRIVTTR